MHDPLLWCFCACLSSPLPCQLSCCLDRSCVADVLGNGACSRAYQHKPANHCGVSVQGHCCVHCLLFFFVQLTLRRQ